MRKLLNVGFLVFSTSRGLFFEPRGEVASDTIFTCDTLLGLEVFLVRCSVDFQLAIVGWRVWIRPSGQRIFDALLLGCFGFLLSWPQRLCGLDVPAPRPEHHQ